MEQTDKPVELDLDNNIRFYSYFLLKIELHLLKFFNRLQLPRTNRHRTTPPDGNLTNLL